MILAPIQEILGSLAKIKSDMTGTLQESLHPGHCLVGSLASENADVNMLNAEAIEKWYKEYVGKRAACGVNLPFKGCCKGGIVACYKQDQTSQIMSVFKNLGCFL